MLIIYVRMCGNECVGLSTLYTHHPMACSEPMCPVDGFLLHSDCCHWRTLCSARDQTPTDTFNFWPQEGSSSPEHFSVNLLCVGLHTKFCRSSSINRVLINWYSVLMRIKAGPDLLDAVLSAVWMRLKCGCMSKKKTEWQMQRGTEVQTENYELWQVSFISVISI